MIDTMISPEYVATNLHSEIGWTRPSDFSVEEIANSIGLIVKELPMTGADGRILMKGNSGIISIRENITHLGRKNFVIAHEIGHFLCHKHLSHLYSDTHKTLAEWYASGPQEQEANRFAAELLMPASIFKAKTVGKRLNLGFIQEMSAFFGVSILACFIRFVNHGNYPVMIIFMENGIVKWKHHSDDFPYKFLAYNSPVPVYTVAGDYFQYGRIEQSPEKVKAIDWFPDSTKLRYEPNAELYEQCYKVSGNGLVSCLWS
jgi:Zn-dependent peptidase ImmA (M78 family)